MQAGPDRVWKGSPSALVVLSPFGPWVSVAALAVVSTVIAGLSAVRFVLVHEAIP